MSQMQVDRIAELEAEIARLREQVEEALVKMEEGHVYDAIARLNKIAREGR